MPRIRDRALQASVFLFPTVEDSKKGTAVGGCGFLLGFPAEGIEGASHIYAVTNRHVVGDTEGSNKNSLVIRLNMEDGSTLPIETKLDEWRSPPTGEDIAVRHVQLPYGSLAIREPFAMLLDEETIAKYDLGNGDEVFSIGRLLGAEASDINRPVVRFGNVARMPAVSIVGYRGSQQPSYLCDMRSRTGFSGSPVYIYLPPHASTWADRKVPIDARKIYGPWILGIHWSQLPYVGPERLPGDVVDPGAFATAVCCVSPAYTLKKFLLEDPELIRERREVEDEYKSEPRAALESEPPTTGDDDEQHSERFNLLVSAAAKKRPQAG